MNQSLAKFSIIATFFVLPLLPAWAQNAAPNDRNAVNTNTQAGDMAVNSPVVFPKEGPLPSRYPPDVAVQEMAAEKDYFLFDSPCRSLAQIAMIQQQMPTGYFTPPIQDWIHLLRVHRILTQGGDLTILGLGDSIVNDTMRSGWVAKLQEAYPKARIKATVYVRGGGGCQHYKEEGRVQKYVLPLKPDLVFIGGISQKNGADIAEVIAQIRAGLPNVEFLLATGTFGTADPRNTTALALARHSGTGQYGEDLQKLATEQRCAYLDMTTPWAEYMRSAKLHPHLFYRDVVHANEYGEQILSKIMMSFFGLSSNIQETTKSLKTYPFSDPDPVAQPGRVYPYFRFDGYTDQGAMQNWKFVELENQFIKVSVTPEIGGKIWGVYEKSTNFPFVYFNNVVKFRDVAMRGAWTSGGIELNFGDIGHAPTVSNPVDYITRINADSSVSCFVGAYDWVSRSRWTVEVNLPKDKAYFTTKSRWFNASPLETSYYHWMNAGFKAAGDLEFVFPGTHYIGHPGDAHPWPKTDKGQQINFYEKNNFGSYKSYHVLGQQSDFYGGYWHNDRAGFVHYAPYSDKLGQKIWVWGLSQQGMIWEKLLTDTDGQYVELQSGRLFNQAAPESANSPFKHVAFQPYAADSWTEHWYPVKNTGGITKAEDWGAWHIARKKDWLVLSISPTTSLADTLTIDDARTNNWGNKKTVYKYQKFIQLVPLQTFTDSVQIPEKDLARISLGNRALSDNPPPKSWNGLERPLESPKDFDWSSEYGQFMQAKGLANQRKYVEAEVFFAKLLAKNKHHVPALGEMAQLAYRKALTKEAAQYARMALSVNTYDPLANYMLGLAARKLLESSVAKDAFSVAALSPQYRAAALTELAKMAVAESDFEKAETFVNQALAHQSTNDHARHLQVIVLRKTNRQAEALKRANALLQENPLDHLARAEKYLITNNEFSKTEFKSLVRSELPHESFIEMALWYRDFNDNEAALSVLEVAPNNPMVKLWKSRISKNWKEATEALAMSPRLVFPFRAEDTEVFGWLLDRESNASEKSWQLHYYYGILLLQLNRPKEAQTQFLACADAPNYAPFYLAKAEIFKGNKAVVQQSLERAYALEPNNWRSVKALTDYYAENNLLQKALEINEKAPRHAHHEGYILGQQKAQLLAKLGRYKECVDFMKTLNLLPNEGASGAHGLFRVANVKYAIQLLKINKNAEALGYLNQAETWPENLGSGAPYDPDNRLTSALKSVVNGGKVIDLEQIKKRLSKNDLELLALFLKK